MPHRIAVGTCSELRAGEVRVVALPRDADGRPREALLLRDEQGVLRAYLNRCAHLPVPLDAGGRRFFTRDGSELQCGTHGARYRLSDGHCTAGPCTGARLVSLELVEQSGELTLLVP